MKVISKKRGEIGVELIDVPYPKLKAGYVIVRVKACGICGSDLHFYESYEPPWMGPILGHEGAGDIVEIGEGVDDFEVGDRVTYNPFAPRTNQFWEVHFLLNRTTIGLY